jgi:ABC-type transporter Mla MlaB component
LRRLSGVRCLKTFDAERSNEKLMLKITSKNESGILTFKLEGKLTGEWVDELWNCWQQAVLPGNRQTINIDLAGVNWVSDEGKALLCAMHRSGVTLLAANLLMAGVIAEIKCGGRDFI